MGSYSWTTYKNAVVQATVNSAVYPPAVSRTLAYLGWSGVSTDATFNGLIDFRPCV